QWSPHSETVVSLQVIDDPLCLLTASRDRSVKLRALPNDGGFANDQSATTSTDQSIGETTITAVTKSRLSDIGGGSSGNSNSNSINDNNFNDINS
ncbi:unnamed protein product, partial [Sphacelaria rigidula]